MWIILLCAVKTMWFLLTYSPLVKYWRDTACDSRKSTTRWCLFTHVSLQIEKGYLKGKLLVLFIQFQFQKSNKKLNQLSPWKLPNLVRRKMEQSKVKLKGQQLEMEKVSIFCCIEMENFLPLLLLAYILLFLYDFSSLFKQERRKAWYGWSHVALMSFLSNSSSTTRKSQKRVLAPVKLREL